MTRGNESVVSETHARDSGHLNPKYALRRIYLGAETAKAGLGDWVITQRDPLDETDPHYFNDGANFPLEGVSARNSQGAIQAAFGSVSYTRSDAWSGWVADLNRNRLWCFPNSASGR